MDEVRRLEAIINKHTDKEERADPGFKEELEAELVTLNEEIHLVRRLEAMIDKRTEKAHKE